ncbi:MAG: HlyD family secretion protein, partial [Alphaproteobacteria bacterium]
MLDDREQLEARSHPAGEGPQMQERSWSAEPAVAADQAGQAEPARRSRLRVVLGVVGVLALGTGAYFGHGWWTIGRYMVATDDAYVGARSSTLSPKVSGYIADVAVEDNAQVKA